MMTWVVKLELPLHRAWHAPERGICPSRINDDPTAYFTRQRNIEDWTMPEMLGRP